MNYFYNQRQSMSSVFAYLSFFLSFSIQSDSLCVEKFYEAALKDTSLSSISFLRVDVIDSLGRDNSILIPNQTLYFYFKEQKYFRYSDYQSYMRTFYKTKMRLEFSEFQKLGGYVFVRKDGYVDKFANGGREKIISHFFENKTFNFKKFSNHFESVVAALYKMGVVVSLVDNGAFAIVYKSECNN